ncbi:MlaD family protein [Pseudonocardia alni]|uniref:Phospholipid/cholesterol/gamma-HCH transport system substrate-binding protein n=1 Tax=Pseudonocardia alni TaxID=33907 RepID=A0A852W0Q5_PSEA5|nr:MlaD family protein [Pseudonocardia antarctica]NYG02603.1 phospholipid/cholesterol/gamma-HCH transport system substrate-binding protein [Pseudonocardia antarctica]
MSAPAQGTTATPRLRRRLPLWVAALAVIGLMLLSLALGLFKPQVTTLLMKLTGSQTRTIHFAANQFLFEDASKAKVAGVDSGVVSSVDPAPDGGAIVTVVVDPEVVDTVGDQPSARLRPTTLLSGLFYIDIVPGGDRTAEWTRQIPVDRTRLPTEVDDVAERLQPDALEGAKTAITQFDETLGNAGGNEALHELLAAAPGTLGPGAGVIESLRGTQPEKDLTDVVRGLQRTTGTLNREPGQLDGIVANLQDTTQVMAETSGPVADAINKLPGVLDTTDAGLERLDVSLDKLRDTAGPARPTVQELDAFLGRAEPVLADARPLVSDLRAALVDTRPLVEGLIPASEGATRVFDDLPAPLERLNGPVLDSLNTPFVGEGPFSAVDSRGVPLKDEVGHMFSNLNKTGAYVDPNGHAVSFHPGPGLGTVPGLGSVSLENMFQQIFHGTGGR